MWAPLSVDVIRDGTSNMSGGSYVPNVSMDSKG